MLGPGGSAPPAPSFSKSDVPPGLEGYTSPVGYSIWSVGSKGGPTRVEKNFLELGILSATVRSGCSTSRLPLHQHSSRLTGSEGGLKRNYRQTDRWLKK